MTETRRFVALSVGGKMMSRLTKELLEAAIEETFRKFQIIRSQYRKGFLTVDEEMRSAERCFREGPWNLLRASHLRLNVTERNYAQFQKDCLDYAEHRSILESGGGAWLTVDSNLGRQASRADRELVLYLLDRFHIPPTYFIPLPERLPAPDLSCSHTWHDICEMRTLFVLTDDGGLLSDPNPVGKSFRLVNELGLAAVLTIKEDRRALHAQIDSAVEARQIPGVPLLAEGCIEGYTAKVRSSELPEIQVHPGNGPALWLTWYENSDDASARAAFPLWQDYYRECEGARARRENILAELLQTYNQRKDN